ncbi:MAG: outer membrane lipoprotein carrier protein LolA [Candidatus Cryptobacteroides sp.]
MKRLFVIFLLLPSLLTDAAAQTDLLVAFADRASVSRIVFDYTYEATSRGVPVCGGGTATVYGDCFHLSGDGLEVYCNGTDKWTVDRESAEVVIEPVDDVSTTVLVNPAILSSSISDEFSWNPTGTETSFGGRKVLSYKLFPRKAGSGISSLTVYMMDQSTPSGMAISLADGTSATVKITSVSFLPLGDLSDFSLGDDSFDSSYVVTDLRF